MKKIIVLLLIIICLICVSSCNETETYISDDDGNLNAYILIGYKCKEIQKIDDIVINIWYSKGDVVDGLLNEEMEDLHFGLSQPVYDYNEIDKYFDYRMYSLIKYHYEQEDLNSDKYDERKWLERAFEVDSLSSYVGKDYKMQRLYKKDDFLNNNLFPYDSNFFDKKPHNSEAWHSEQVHIDPNCLNGDKGIITVEFGKLVKCSENDYIVNSYSVNIRIDYEINGDTIKFKTWP